MPLPIKPMVLKGVLPIGCRRRDRRVPGLRREEVARLAGVSTDYYTRLEQGRHPNVSEGVLASVARALRLSDDERGYLFTLARPRPAGSPRRRLPRVSRTRPVVDRMVEVLGEATPAFVIDYRQEVLAANRLARALIADFDAMPYRDRHMARFVMLDPAARGRYEDWDEVAEIIVANMRLATARHPDDRQRTNSSASSWSRFRSSAPGGTANGSPSAPSACSGSATR